MVRVPEPIEAIGGAYSYPDPSVITARELARKVLIGVVPI